MDSVLVISTGAGQEEQYIWRMREREAVDFRVSESESELGCALVRWVGAQSNAETPIIRVADGGFPLSFSQFGTPPLDSNFVPGSPAFVADVTAADPMNYIISFANEQPARFAEMQANSRILFHTLLNDLIMVVGLRRIYYHQIEEETHHKFLRYIRLLLPVMADGKVCKVYAYCRPLKQKQGRRKQNFSGLLI